MVANGPEEISASGLRARRPVHIAHAAAVWLAAAVLVVTQGAANVLGSKAPPPLLSIARWQSSALSSTATLHLLQPQIPGAMTTARRGALEAWRRDPTNHGAVRTLWELERRRGSTDSVARLASTARALGWRDYLTELYTARDAAERGDETTAMRHISAALTTHRRARAQVMPTFIKLTADPRLIPQLATIIASKPDWLDQFNAEWVPNAPSPVTMAALSQRLDAMDASVSPQTRAGIIGRLVADNRYALAASEYRRARPQLVAAGQTLSDGFDHVFTYRPFDWQLNDSGEIGAFVARAANSPTQLVGETTTSGSSEIARRILLLPPGNYQFVGSVASIEPDSGPDVPGGSGGQLEVVCAVQGQPLGKSAVASGTIRARVTVPEGCPAVYLFVRQVSADPAGANFVYSPIRMDRLPAP